MRFRVSHLLGVLVLLGVPAVANAQQQDLDGQIQLGGIELRLGMAQQEVLRRLAVVYEVTHFDNLPGNWSVTRRGGQHHRLVGVVSFKDERLTFVNKSWGPEDQTARSLATALYNAVQSISREGRRVCTAFVEGTDAASQVVLNCGQRQLKVSVPRDSDVAAGVSEILSSTR